MDQQHGLETSFHENGSPRETTCYQNGDRVQGLNACTGKAGKSEVLKTLFKNGKPQEISTVQNGKRNGKYERYFEDGKPEETATYVDDKLEGVEKVWRSNGKLHLQTTYKAGNKEGEELIYLENGKLAERNTWKAGVQVGAIEYYENGKVRLEETSVGERWTRKEYNDDGKLCCEVPFTLGAGYWGDVEIYDGVEKRYHENGKLWREMPYRAGNRSGTAKSYYEDGKLSGEDRYKDDRLVGRKEYDRNGKVLLAEEYNADGSRK
jgi:antitoxin component YwqK of YwqJK toxin-antitoxin module